MAKRYRSGNPVIKILDRIADLAILSGMWIVLSLPIVTLGNATHAMLYTFRNVLVKEEGTIVRSFWKTFRQGLKKGLGVSAVFAGVCIAIVLGYFALVKTSWSKGLQLAIMIPAIIWLGMMLYDFFLLFGTGKKLIRQLAITFVLSIRHLPMTVLMEALLIVAIILIEMFPPSILFLPAGFCWLFNKWFEKIENQYQVLLIEQQTEERT